MKKSGILLIITSICLSFQISATPLLYFNLQNNTTIIEGTIEKGGNGFVYLNAVQFGGGIQLIDSTLTDEKGRFNFSTKLDEIGFYTITFKMNKSQKSNKRIPLTLQPGDHVIVTMINSENFNFSPVYKGTKWAEPINGFMQTISAFKTWKQGAKREGDDAAFFDKIAQHQDKVNQYAVMQIKENPTNPANMLLMTSLLPVSGFKDFNPNYIPVLKQLVKAYKAAYPKAEVTQSIDEYVANVVKNYRIFESYQIGAIAPDIILPTPKGDTIRLSDLRGKYVLLDFWASWCGPCRKENPNVVAAYKKYHENGFTVYSVSLDKDKSRWVQAIEQDGLIWETNVSDLKFWSSKAAAKYGIKSIPHSFLIDPNGKIIAENLRGEALKQKLNELFKK